jgi:hypothetical protein
LTVICNCFLTIDNDDDDDDDDDYVDGDNDLASIYTIATILYKYLI